MSVTIEGMEQVSKKLGSLSRFSAWAYEPMEQTVSIIHDEIATYPEKADGAFSRLATPGQRRAYWAKVRSGEANHREGVGYVRTGGLGRKWVTKVENTTNGVRGEIGNNTAYAQYVQQRTTQQPFHTASGWATAERVLEELDDKIQRIWGAAINRILNK